MGGNSSIDSLSSTAKNLSTMCILVNIRRAKLTAIRTQQDTKMPNVVDHIDGALGFRGSSPSGGASAGHDELIAVAVSLAHSASSNSRSTGSKGVMFVRRQRRLRDCDKARLPRSNHCVDGGWCQISRLLLFLQQRVSGLPSPVAVSRRLTVLCFEGS